MVITLTLKIGINGYGTIGKRIADALTKLNGVKIIGVAKTKPDYSVHIALEKGFRIYTLKENIQLFKNKGVEVEGSVEDLVEQSDIVIDATPGGVGRKYVELYRKYGKPAIFQGGEKPDIVDISFNSFCNYEEVEGKKYVRVVSCNTTGLLRIICLLNEEFGVEKVRATIIRRGADPKEDKRGPINSIKLDPAKIPSHHALDVKTVLPWLDIITAAYAVPTTLMHVHSVYLVLKNPVTKDRLLDVFSKTRRILLVDADKSGIDSTAKIVEMARDSGRYRYDIPESIIWVNTLRVDGKEVLLTQAIHQESIVIPENIDAVKALAGLEQDKWKAIRETDELLGLGKLTGIV